MAGLRALLALSCVLVSGPGAGGAEPGRHYLGARPSAPPKHIGREERAIARAFERVNPAVVVLLTQESEVAEEGGDLVLKLGRGIGSGVAISAEGDVLTAAHVVSGARSLRAKLFDGTEVGVSVLFSDAASDIAVLRMDPGHPPVPSAVLGNSDEVQVGQVVLVIGAPLGAERSLSVGHVSARRNGKEFFGGGIAAEMLQTDAALNRGNSGGPLMNLQGEIIGIVSRILSTTGGSEGLGFAIASNTVKALLGEDPVPWIGVNALFVGPDLTGPLHIPSEGALLVQSVVEGSPAERAGIRGGSLPALLGSTRVILGGDVILAIDEQETCHQECVAHEFQSQAQARTLSVTLWRDGARIRMEIPVEHRHVLRHQGSSAEEGNDPR